MSIEEIVKSSGLIGAFVGVVMWFGRLEWRSRQNAEELAKVELRLASQRREDRDETQKMLAEIRNDVKQLLQRQ